MSKCSECSKLQPTCCENTEICVTNGDIKRIAGYIGRNDFYHLMLVSEEMKEYSETTSLEARLQIAGLVPLVGEAVLCLAY
jgi:hypothetical protein